MIPYRSIHFVGVLTPEMASAAYFALKQGIAVSGSDDHINSIFLNPLRQAGLTFFDMFSQHNIRKDVELVVLSPYYDERHSEAMTAQKLGKQIITLTNYLKQLTQDYQRMIILDDYEGQLIASFLAHILDQGHFHFSGFTQTVAQKESEISLAHASDGNWFVLPLAGFKRDAGTYEGSFMSFDTQVAILPTVRYDYPELYTALDDVYETYYRFVKRIPRNGLIIGNGDYSRMKRLRSHLADRHIETFGFDNDVMWRIKQVTTDESGTEFYLTYANRTYGPLRIPFFGETMLYAAVASIIAADFLDLKLEVIDRGLKSLPPIKRYWDTQTDAAGRLIIDDRADHPETIRSILETIKLCHPKKAIWCLYQPGSYLRVKALQPELEKALALADTVYIADIKGYPKEKSEGLHIRHFIASMKKQHPQTYYIDPSTNLSNLLNDRVKSTDCIVTLGVEGVCQEAVEPLLKVSS